MCFMVSIKDPINALTSGDLADVWLVLTGFGIITPVLFCTGRVWTDSDVVIQLRFVYKIPTHCATEEGSIAKRERFSGMRRNISDFILQR
mmetsp:Transcript_126438/g.316107  ORF Transcript_126438/g.316107 Transcript_126438/m.316107 type:complete len:90 (+) Transcript_126438:704-973(+)